MYKDMYDDALSIVSELEDECSRLKSLVVSHGLEDKVLKPKRFSDRVRAMFANFLAFCLIITTRRIKEGYKHFLE